MSLLSRVLSRLYETHLHTKPSGLVRLEDSTHPTELAAVLSRQWLQRTLVSEAHRQWHRRGYDEERTSINVQIGVPRSRSPRRGRVTMENTSHTSHGHVEDSVTVAPAPGSFESPAPSKNTGERSPTPTANVYEVFYAHQTLGRFDVSQTPRGSPEVLNIHRVLRE